MPGMPGAPPPPPGGGGGGRVAMLEAQMAQATASGNFEMCISLREQIKQAKRQDLEAQMAQATASGHFERCIQLRAELSRLV